MKLVLLKLPLEIGEDRANLDAIHGAVVRHAGTLSRDDIVLLPEHFDFRASHDEYVADVCQMSKSLGCHVVGGSHHDEPGADGQRRNSGVVASPDGASLGRYEKLRPYAREREIVTQGSALGEFNVAGRNLLVLICADFWFADLFGRAKVLPDVVLVPAHSVSRKPSPDYSRNLWRHLAIARAYEFGTFVGVSDWAHAAVPPDRLPASGVAGFADPTTADPDAFFHPVDDTGVLVVDLDFDALEAFRRDRVGRGFFWKTPA